MDRPGSWLCGRYSTRGHVGSWGMEVRESNLSLVLGHDNPVVVLGTGRGACDVWIRLIRIRRIGCRLDSSLCGSMCSRSALIAGALVVLKS